MTAVVLKLLFSLKIQIIIKKKHTSRSIMSFLSLGNKRKGYKRKRFKRVRFIIVHNPFLFFFIYIYIYIVIVIIYHTKNNRILRRIA